MSTRSPTCKAVEEVGVFHRQLDVAYAEGHPVAGFESPRTAIDLAEAVARTHEVDDDGHESAQLAGQTAHAAQDRAVELVVAVGEVQSHHVDAAVEQPAEHGLVGGGRANGGDDLGSARVAGVAPRGFGSRVVGLGHSDRAPVGSTGGEGTIVARLCQLFRRPK